MQTEDKLTSAQARIIFNFQLTNSDDEYHAIMFHVVIVCATNCTQVR